MKSTGRSSRWRISLHFTLAVLLTGALTVAVPGCGGCKKKPPIAAKSKKAKKAEEDELEKKKKEKPKPDFESTKLSTFPDDPTSEINYVKPGHWVIANQQIKANNFDFRGDLECAAVDSEDNVLEVERTPFQMKLSRPSTLPKGQIKNLEMLYHVPHRPALTNNVGRKQIRLRSSLQTGRGGREVMRQTDGTIAMADHCFFLTVLARDPDAYGYLKKIASIQAPRYRPDSTSEGGDSTESRMYYRVVLPKIEGFAPLPSHPLTWTSMAVVVWDELNPNQLSPDQQQALLDWLHWGGQLIVSGPDSLDLLKGSFLADFLPAEKVQAKELGQSDFDPLSQAWSVGNRRTNDPRQLSLVPNQPVVGVELRPHDDAAIVPNTGGLVIERRVGGGRIVVTAFSLDDRQIVNWRSYDSFFNAVLLRRPPREFRGVENNTFIESNWAGLDPGLADDPRFISTLRYFTRDIGYLSESDERNIISVREPPPPPPVVNRPFFTPQDEPKRAPSVGTHPLTDDWHFGGYSYVPESGVAGWNDFSAAAESARESLQDASGIKIPEASFILRVLAVYLLVLVPANWALFRMLGRVELAWATAPLIAIAGTVAVVHMAQLDIGFLRSRTELGILEVQGGYARGHLTRYTSLYTSLSTPFELSFDDASALAEPFSTDPKYKRKLHDFSSQVHFRRDQSMVLSGFQVDSNSLGMVHSEQMLNLGGALRLIGNDDAGYQVQNHTELLLHGVGVLRGREGGGTELAWVGELAPKTAAPLRFKPVNNDERFFAEWDEAATTRRGGLAVAGEVNLSRHIQLATQRLRLQPGDVRLLGWTDHEAPGLVFRPSAAQTTIRTLVLGHLRRGTLPPPRPDINCKEEIRDDKPADADDKSPTVPETQS